MPKKIFAVTNVKAGNGPGEFVAAGEVVDPDIFGKEVLLQLHEQGAIEIRTVDVEPEPDVESTEEETPEVVTPEVKPKEETPKVTPAAGANKK